MVQDIDYSNVGRNDPCPCGSGKKFKKCHFLKNQIKQHTQEATADLDQFIKAEQIPFHWYQGLQTIINRRDWVLMYQVFQPGSPITERWTKEAFVKASRDSPSNVPGGGTFDLRRFRMIGDHVFVMGARGLDDRRSPKATFEVLSLINTSDGYQIIDLEQSTVAKADLKDDEDIPFEDFSCVQAVYAAERAKPLERPNFERYDPNAPPPPQSEEAPEEQA